MNISHTSKRISLKYNLPISSSSDYLKIRRDEQKNQRLFNFPSLFQIIILGCMIVIICILAVSKLDTKLFNNMHSYIHTTIVSYHRSFSKLSYHSFNIYNSSISYYKAKERKVKQQIDGLIRLNDFEFIWQKASEKISMQGVVFIANGCKREPYEWWPDTFCKNCTGLPMQISIVNTLVKHGYNVMVMSPVEMKNSKQCWHQNDRQHISLALTYIYHHINRTTNDLPLYAIGIENGGVFIGQYAESFFRTYLMPFSAICLMYSGIWHESTKPGIFPPVIFINNPRNGGLIQYNLETIDKLAKKKINAIQYIYTQPVVKLNYFMNASLTSEESRSLKEFLFRESYISLESYLIKDPNVGQYHTQLKQAATVLLHRIVPNYDSMSPIPGQSPLMQLLRVAYGHKEITDEYIFNIIEWFKQYNRCNITNNLFI